MKPTFQENGVEIYQGDCREVLRSLPDESVNCVVTSPPYWGLRDYGCEGQVGLEDSPVQYIATMRQVFAEVRRVLRDDGTAWINMGDSYNSIGHKKSSSGYGTTGLAGGKAQEHTPLRRENSAPGLKPKDLVGVPWMLAFALREDGWYLRQDIIWSKPNPMPESVTDRCTKAHEYIFLLSKSERYYYNAAAIAEQSVTEDIRRPYTSEGAWQLDGRASEQRHGGEPRGTTGKNAFRGQGADRELESGKSNRDGREMRDIGAGLTRNRRSVWEVTTQPFPEAHFATFPEDLIKPCILAGCPEGGIVLDPFGGSGTTAKVARELHCKAILVELNPEYIQIAARRLSQHVFNFSENRAGGVAPA